MTGRRRHRARFVFGCLGWQRASERVGCLRDSSSLDETILHDEQEGRIDLRREAQGGTLDFHKPLQVGRLQQLEKMELARELEAGVWSVNPNLETTDA